MIGDVAREVAGACADVSVLIGDGSDPHLYAPTASDVGRLRDAAAIFHVGFGLEGRLGEVLARLADDRPVVAVGPASLDRAELIATDELEGVDPHVWMDPGLWARIAPTIAETLAPLAPDCAGAMAERAETYAAELAALRGWVAESVGSIPEANRVLVTAHDAFGYYAQAFGLREAAIQGISTEAEAGVSDIRAVAAQVVEAGVPAVFIETTINPRTIEAMLEAVRAMGGAAEIGGALYADAMGEEGTPTGTYVGMIRANTLAIVEGLGGEPAPWPEALDGWAETWGLAN
jgi:manganese/zinc/iron transport system substrate-binding protein